MKSLEPERTAVALAPSVCVLQCFTNGNQNDVSPIVGLPCFGASRGNMRGLYVPMRVVVHCSV